MNQLSVPDATQLHIGIYGKRNSGKSTLINALIGENLSRLSDVEEATMDSVYKIIEIDGIGACVLIDTVGFDDDGYQAEKRIEKTKIAMQKTDIALIVCSDEDIALELEWAKEFRARKVPVIMVINKIDQITNTDKIRNKIHDAIKIEPLKISAISRMGIEVIKEEIILKLPQVVNTGKDVEECVQQGDTVVIVLSQELSALTESLATSYIHTLTELLNQRCMVVTITNDKLDDALLSLKVEPKLIITDARAYQEISVNIHEDIRITTFGC